MKRRKGKFAVAILSMLFLLSFLTLPASASTTEYLWNEDTQEVIEIEDIQEIIENTEAPVLENDEGVPIDGSIIETEKRLVKRDTEIGIQWYIEQLVRYDQTKSPIDYKKKYVGQHRVDNSDNKYTSAKLIFTASSGGSWEVSGSTSLETKAELNLIVSKVDATVTVGGAVSRSWSKGYEYGTEVEVPKGKIGTATAYIPGTSSAGNAVYKLTHDSTGETFYENRARGAIVPAKNSWNIVISIP